MNVENHYAVPKEKDRRFDDQGSGKTLKFAYRDKNKDPPPLSHVFHSGEHYQKTQTRNLGNVGFGSRVPFGTSRQTNVTF